jgi:uncharacterized repeat protein (TIGR01451 family)
MKTILALLLTSCFFLWAAPRAAGQVQAGGSYLNISRPSGGPVVTGDVLEIRAVISIPSGTTITNLVFTDNVPAGTSFQSGTLETVTNEGVILGTIPNTGSYTDAGGDDRGTISGSAITINMGTGATAAAGGSVTGGVTTPVFYSSATILMAAYRVTVTASSSTVITLGGKFTYTNGSAQTLNLAANSINVNPPYGCSGNSPINLLGTETNGTFSSGTAQNRGSSASVTGFTFANISAGNPADGQYSIIKNTSPTQYTGSTPASGDRVFGVWDIIGDHTGTSTSAGNPPAASGANKGYMLAVNASYAPSSVFSATISGLSINTGYTFSFWLYNICGKCGANPATNASSGTPGVKPNLAFEVNGNDYFSTGEIAYTGTWVKQSFNFNSGASTSITINVKNNAPGGGGNDWVIDDLGLYQCISLLPLQLTQFSAVRQNSDIALRWHTENEIQVARYEVERSVDGLAFSQVGTVFSNAAQQANDYQFRDTHASGYSRYFYRLRIVDIDGRFSYSNILTVNTGDHPGNRIQLAPNPAYGNTQLYIDALQDGPGQVEVFSISGARVWSRPVILSRGNNQLLLGNASGLARGMYLVKVSLGTESFTSKLVME